MGPLHILIVEDDHLIGLLLADMLDAMGLGRVKTVRGV